MLMFFRACLREAPRHWYWMEVCYRWRYYAGWLSLQLGPSRGGILKNQQKVLAQGLGVDAWPLLELVQPHLLHLDYFLDPVPLIDLYRLGASNSRILGKVWT